MEIGKFNPYKTKHQLARAWRLVAVLDTLEADHETRLRFAENLTETDWLDKVAVVADHLADLAGDTCIRFSDRPPSDDTLHYTLGLLQMRVTNEQMADSDIADAFAGFPKEATR